jgi:hypothetical protein
VDYQTTKTRSLNIAFVLEPASLQQLANILSESGGPLEYTVKFADGSSVTYPAIGEVVALPNPTKCSIVSLIAGTSASEFRAASIVFRKSPEPTVEYTISGPQQQVVYLAYKLDQWVATITQFYSRFYQPVYAGLAIVFAAIIPPVLVWNHVIAHFLPNVPRETTPWHWQKSVSVVCMWVLLGAATKLFPTATFAVGQGAKRHETFKKVREALLYTIPSALILGVIAAWIYDHYR